MISHHEEHARIQRSNSDVSFDLSVALKDKTAHKKETKLETIQEEVEEDQKETETDNKPNKPRRHSLFGAEKRKHHSHDYVDIKIYSISKNSSRERLKKKMTEGMFKDYVQIDWDKIME